VQNKLAPIIIAVTLNIGGCQHNGHRAVRKSPLLGLTQFDTSDQEHRVPVSHDSFPSIPKSSKKMNTTEESRIDGLNRVESAPNAKHVVYSAVSE
jgi:hypothetical protein